MCSLFGNETCMTHEPIHVFMCIKHRFEVTLSIDVTNFKAVPNFEWIRPFCFTLRLQLTKSTLLVISVIEMTLTMRFYVIITFCHTFKRANSNKAHDIRMATNLDKCLYFSNERESFRLIGVIYNKLIVI